MARNRLCVDRRIDAVMQRIWSARRTPMDAAIAAAKKRGGQWARGQRRVRDSRLCGCKGWAQRDPTGVSVGHEGTMPWPKGRCLERGVGMARLAQAGAGSRPCDNESVTNLRRDQG